MGIFSNIGRKINKSFHSVKKEARHLSNITKKVAPMVERDVEQYFKDNVNKDTLKNMVKASVSNPRRIENTAFGVAMIIAPEIAPELMMGKMIIDGAIEAKQKKGLPTDTLMTTGINALTGGFGPTGRLGAVARFAGNQLWEDVKPKLTEEAKKVIKKIEQDTGVNVVKAGNSKEDALGELKKVIDENKRLKKQIRELENLIKPSKETKKQSPLLDSVITKIKNKKTLKKSTDDKPKSKNLENILKKVKERANQYKYSKNIE